MLIKLIKKEELNSSNSFAQHLINIDSQKGHFVVWVNRQISGRGQRNNSWWSEMNKSLTFSLVLQNINLLVEDLFLLNIVCSLSVHKTLSKYLENVQIKWPNDVLIGNKKVCGILIENTLRGNKIKNAIMGVGLNVNESSFPKHLVNVSSMHMASGLIFDREMILTEIVDTFFEYYVLISNHKYLYKMYYKALLGYNVDLNYKDKAGDFVGRIINIERNGRLNILDVRNNTRKYLFKEVELIL